MARLLALLNYAALALAYTQITYPGQRGNNLLTNGTAPQDNSNLIGVDWDAATDSFTFPYGMQWTFPCGGLPLSHNRTKWPYKGGAISIQPGWGTDNKKNLFYINMGISANGHQAPPNMSHILVPPFQVLGPSNDQYNGTFCLPQVPMPVNVSLAVGDNVTIQVIQVAEWGASMYNCVDVTLAEPEDVEEVTAQNCFNASDMNFELVFSSAALTNDAASLFQGPSLTPLFVAAFVAMATALL